MIGHRTPTIEEFVPGFEFERHTATWQMVVVDFGSSEKIDNKLVEQIGEPYEEWRTETVPDYSNNQTYTETREDGTTWTWLRNPYMTFPRENYFEGIESGLKEGRIRCKI